MTFSVGKITIGSDTLAKCTGITLRFDGSPVELYAGGFSLPRDIQLGNQSVTISVEYAEWADLDVSAILTNEVVSVVLLASSADEDRGLSGLTLANCKAVSWEIASTQDGFVTYRLELKQKSVS
jgi:hypothetical protein